MIALLLIAQIRLHGVVQDSTSRLVVPATLITVEDAARRPIMRTLTRQDGTFDLTIPSGATQLLAEFIGYAPSRTSITESTNTVSIRLRPTPVMLTSVVAETKRQCRRSDDPRVVAVWYAARAALGASRVNSDRRFRTMEFTRIVDLNLKLVDYDTMGFSLTRGTDSYEAMPLDSIEQFGYVRGKEHKTFYGPDAELLLSDQFADKHCFGIKRDAAHTGFVGLEFWPKDGMKKPDIQGAMWVDEKSRELNSVEFAYTGIRPWIAEKLAAGIVNFGKTRDGSWVVRDWYIRSPYYEKQTFDRGAGTRNVLAGGIEGGGEFLGLDRSSADPDDTTSVSGTVYDSVHSRPLENVPVYLAGTDYATDTDSLGQFTLSGVSAGTHFVTFFTPVYALLPLHKRVQRLRLERAKPTEAILALPREETMLAELCDDSVMKRARHTLNWKSRLAVVAGTVSSRTAPAAGVRVEILWDDKNVPSGDINKKVSSVFADTDERGYYIACGIPASLDGTIRVFRDGIHLLTEPLKGGPLIHARDLIIN